MAGHYVCLMGYCKEMLHKSGHSVVIFSKSFDFKLWICVLLEHRRRKCAECTGHVQCSCYSEWALMFSSVKKDAKTPKS